MSKRAGQVTLRPGGLFQLLVNGTQHPVQRQTIVGRGHDADLPIDNDPRISRAHASFEVVGAALVVRDLDSANGVFVNGERVGERAPHPLQAGDVVIIGDTRVEVSLTGPPISDVVPRDRRSAPTVTKMAAPTGPSAAALGVLSNLIDKALSLGEVDEALRIAQPALHRHVAAVIVTRQFSSDVQREFITKYCVRLGFAARTVTWFEQLLDAHAAAKSILPADVVDQLYTGLPSVTSGNFKSLQNYLETISSPNLSPADQFVLRRLTGLLAQLRMQ